MSNIVLELDSKEPNTKYISEYMNRLDELRDMGSITVPEYLIIGLLSKLVKRLEVGNEPI